MNLPFIRLVFNWLLALIFGLSILSPLVVMMAKSISPVSEAENRRLTEFPEFQFGETDLKQFKEQLESFFNDHFGLRSTILEAANKYRRVVFNETVSSKVILGESDWMYFNINGALRDFIGEFDPTEEQLSQLYQGLELKQKWLASLGIRYLLMPIPGKMSTYSEYMPARLRHLKGRSRMQGFLSYLEGKESSHSVLNIGAAFSRAKQSNQLFFQTDTHWNDDGAYIAYRVTMEKLATWINIGPPLSLDQFIRKEYFKKGDVARAAGIGLNTRERSEKLELIEPCSVEPLSNLGSFANTPAFQQTPKALPVVARCPTKTARAVVVHDSFGEYLQQFFNEHFNEVIYMHSYDTFGMKSFLQDFQPDVYIDVRIERRFANLLEVDPSMAADLN